MTPSHAMSPAGEPTRGEPAAGLDVAGVDVAGLDVAGVDDLVAGVREGRARAVGRALSMIEDAAPSAPRLLAALERARTAAAPAWVIGLTGAPGVGKSSLTSALVAAFRAAGERVAVLAVDPSSPVTGGAVLGDRIRLQEHGLDPDVFVRSMATRGRLGGLAGAAHQAVRVLDAAGFGVIVVETVGVGQGEVDVAGLADSVVLLTVPGLGDDVQAAKAGVLEVADVIVVNKADQDGVEATVRDLRRAVSDGLVVGRGDGAARGDGAVGQAEWRVPVLTTVATSGEGVPDLVEALTRHRADTAEEGRAAHRRQARAAAEIVDLALGLLRQRVSQPARAVAEGRLSAADAAREVLLETARGLDPPGA